MEIKCKCGSTKVFTEAKGNQTGVYCSECGKWIKWATKEEIRVINHSINAIEIPKGATNGDVFTIMLNKTFPKTIVMYENDENRLTINPIFSREWWEKPYEESEGK